MKSVINGCRGTCSDCCSNFLVKSACRHKSSPLSGCQSYWQRPCRKIYDWQLQLKFEKWQIRRFSQPSRITALWCRLSMTIIKLVLTFFSPWPCIGFESTCSAQFVDSMLCDLWPTWLKHSGIVKMKSLHLNDQYSECKSQLTKDWKTEAQFMNCKIFKSFFCYIMKRATGNQGIIKTVNTIFVQRSKLCYWTAIFSSFYLFFFKWSHCSVVLWICPHPVIKRELLGGTHL